MNNYCTTLNLDLKIFNSDLHPVEFIKLLPVWKDTRFTTPSGNKHFRIPKDILSQNFKDFFYQRGIQLLGVEVFYLLPGGSNIIHSDVNPIGDVAKINWVYGGANSIMEWYQVNSNYKSNALTDRAAATIANSPTIRFLKEEVNLMHSQFVECPSIIQAGCPHNMKNGTTERFCISTIFKHTETNMRVTMAEAQIIFKDFLVPHP